MLERSCILLLLLAPGVIRIQQQPERLNVLVEGRLTYVPDFRVTLRDQGRELIEVRPEKFVAKDAEVFSRAAICLAERGHPFYVCTDKALEKGRVNRAEHCYFMAKRAAPPDQLSLLVSEVRTAGRLQIADALGLVVSEDVIAHAVGRRLVSAGPDVDLSPKNWLTSMESQIESENLSAGHWLGCSPWPAHLAV